MPTIKIRNKKTGEVKEIDAREAVNYGMDPSDVLSYLKNQQGVETFGQPEAPTIGSKEETQNFEQQLAQDAASGQFTVPQLFQKYGTLIDDPNRMLQIYNQQQNVSGGYGPATESSEWLRQQGVDVKLFRPEEGTPDVQARRGETGVVSAEEIEKVPESIKKRTGTASAFATAFKLNFFPFLVKGKEETELADLENKYFIMVKSYITAVEGARPSDYDARQYQKKSGPSIMNSPQVNEVRVKNLMKTLSTLTGKSTPQGRPPISDFLIP